MQTPRFLRIFMVCLTFLVALPALAHEPAEPAETAEPAADDGFAAYLVGLRAAVRKNDKAKVADLCAFPLRSYEMAGEIAKKTRKKLRKGEERPPLDPEIDRPTFLRHYKLALDATAKRNLLTRKPLFHEGDAYAGPWYSIGMKSGKGWTAWFVFARDDAGAWQLRGTDNVSE